MPNQEKLGVGRVLLGEGIDAAQLMIYLVLETEILLGVLRIEIIDTLAVISN